MTRLVTCTCREHQGGGPVVLGVHTFGRHEAEHPGGWTRWRWACGCGRKGRWRAQSDSVAYHAWLIHASGGKRRR